MPYVGRDLQRGNYLKLDDIGSSFNGSTTTFNLTSGGNAFFPGSAFSILVSLGGVVQEPESAYQIDRSQIIFATAPTSSSDFFCIALGVALGVGVPGHNTVGNNQLAKPISYGDYFRWDSANNRVGINTLLPSTALDVVGDATFSGNVAIGGTLTYEDVANIDAVGIITARAGIEDKTLTTGRVVYVGANGRLVDNANFTFDGTDVGIARSIFHLGDTNTSIGFDAADNIEFITGGSERIRIKSTGEVGIGNNNPGELLSLKNTSAQCNMSLQAATDGECAIFLGDTDSVVRSAIKHHNDGDYLAFFTGGNTERLRIRSDGHIGINTITPTKLVTIKADAPFVRLEAMDGSDKRLDFEVTNVGIATISATQSSQQLSFKTTSGEGIRINSSGNVGINSASPGAALEVNGGSSYDVAIFNTNHADGPLIPIQRSGTNIGFLGSGKNLASLTGGADDLGLRSQANLIFTSGGGTERLRITSTGTVLKGLTSARSNYGDNTSGVEYGFQIEGTSAILAGLSIVRNSDDENDGGIVLGKTRATSNGGNTVVQAGDDLGNLTFAGNDGSTMLFGAEIFAEVQSGVGNDDMPTDLIFKTNGGSTTTAERLRIKSDGKVFLHGTGATGANNSTARLPNGYTFNIAGNTSEDGISIVRYNSGYGAYGLNIGRSKSNTVGNNTAVVDNDELGHITFYGANGSSFSYAAQITAIVNGEVGTGGDTSDMPAALSFRTTADGSGGTTPTERLRIGSNGGTMIQNAGTLVTTTNETLYVQGEGHNGHGTTNTRSVVSIAGAISSNNNAAGLWIGARTNTNTAVIGTRTSTGNLAFETYSGGWGERMRLTYNGSLNIGGDFSQSTYTMKVTGSFAATTKSFVIDHPTKENHTLRYACLEGPENSVYVRGKTSESVIELPEYWVGLVHEDSITVNVTPIGNHKVWVESINNNSITIGSDGSEYFYTVFAERKDVDKLEVEVAD